MKRSLFLLPLFLSLLLTGCSWMEGQQLSVTPHRQQRQTIQSDVVTASDYLELLKALEDVVSAGREVAAIHMAEYPQEAIEHGIRRAVQHTLENDPIGSYAVEDILYEIGTSSGVPALSVTVVYRHNRSEIQRIRKAGDMARAESIVADALEDFEPSLVLLVDNYETRDFTQFVRDYAETHPAVVMEIPQVTQGIYGTGKDRVVELIFTYQTSRDSLPRMRAQIQPVFDAASLYVSGDSADRLKFSQLYAFLMERFDYKIETSLTPAYSLLRHGVGDSRAFATVYAAMCHSAGLECLVVTGTHAGEPRTWNIVLDDGQYFHVDLLRSNDAGSYREFTDGEMAGYVWDYSAYPACGTAVVPQEPAEE